MKCLCHTGAIAGRPETASASAIGVRALGSMPMSGVRRQAGQSDVPVQIQGVPVQPGDWLYADEDGVVVAGHPLSP